jgi:hypothetical protein
VLLKGRLPRCRVALLALARGSSPGGDGLVREEMNTRQTHKAVLGHLETAWLLGFLRECPALVSHGTQE